MYIYQADLWCDDCGRAICERIDTERGDTQPITDDGETSNEYPQEASDDEESDTPTHCAAGAECLNAERLDDGTRVGCIMGTLTSDGVKYVLERALANKDEGKAIHGGVEIPGVSPCVALWIEQYDVTLPPLEAYAWPGGYPLEYIDPAQGDVLCAECAGEERGKGTDLLCGAYWEGPTIDCANCGAEIESAYGDPDAEEKAAEDFETLGPTFENWAQVIDHVKRYQRVFYKAPLDWKAVEVCAYPVDNCVHVVPPGTDCDAFDADEGHLDRFRRG